MCGKMAWVRSRYDDRAFIVICDNEVVGHSEHSSTESGHTWTSVDDLTCGATKRLYSTGTVLTCTQERNHGGDGPHGRHWDSEYTIGWYDPGHEPQRPPRKIPKNADKRAIANIGLSGLAPGFMAYVSGKRLPRCQRSSWFPDATTHYEWALYGYYTGEWLEDWMELGGEEAHRRNIACQLIPDGSNPHDGCLDCNGTGWAHGVVGSSCDVPRFE